MNEHPGWNRWLERRFNRRRVLQGAAIGIGALGAAACAGTPERPLPDRRAARAAATAYPATDDAGLRFSQWSRHARLANVAMGEDPDVEEMEDLVRKLKAEHVSVVEVDTHLSDFLNDREFEGAMAVAYQLNQIIHREGMRVVWYYPALEVVSIGGQHGPSMFKTHPDWVQVALNGRPNVFYGGVVFWVDPGDESAWMSPNGPWREVYYKRVKMLAQTGADGLWPDVPLYFDVAYSWPDISKWARAAFRAEMGLSLPSKENWQDPTWRRWIAWRHQSLNQFLVDLAAAARSVNPAFEIFVETVPCDFYDATSMGLDGAYLRLAEGITHAWEVDTVSDSHSMYYAEPDDWISLISMYRYCRAASGPKPAWVFTKGWVEIDARAVMAEALASGCNPYQVQVPGKTVGVGGTMRAHMYRWVEANTREIFDAVPQAEIALFHSSPSRDYVDPTDGTAKYCSTPGPAEATEWWSDKHTDSCYEKQWIGEYRGLLKLLVHEHLAYHVLTSPTFRPADLEGIEVLLLPDLEAVFDRDAEIIRAYVDNGGTIVITGPNPTGLNEFGDERAEYALADVLGFGKRRRASSAHHHPYGAGQTYYFPDLIGLDYLNDGDEDDAAPLLQVIEEYVTPWVTTTASETVRLEVKELDGNAILHFTNHSGVTGRMRIVPATFGVDVVIPAGRQVEAVEVTSPDQPTPDRESVAFTVTDGQVRFELTVAQYSVAIVRWK